MIDIRQRFDGALVCAVALAVLLATVSPVAAGVAGNETASVAPPDDPHDPLLLQPTPATVQGKAGQNVTVKLMLLNRGNTTSDAPIVDAGQLPANWTVVDHSTDGAHYREENREWLWQYLRPEEKVRPTLTVSLPENVTGGTYTLSVVADDANGHKDTATVRVVVTPKAPKEKGPKDRFGGPTAGKPGSGPPVFVNRPRGNFGHGHADDRSSGDSGGKTGNEKGREKGDNGKSDGNAADDSDGKETKGNDSEGQSNETKGNNGKNTESGTNGGSGESNEKNGNNTEQNSNEGNENSGEKNGSKGSGKKGKEKSGDENDTSKGKNEGSDEAGDENGNNSNNSKSGNNSKNGKKTGRGDLGTPSKWFEQALNDLFGGS